MCFTFLELLTAPLHFAIILCEVPVLQCTHEHRKESDSLHHDCIACLIKNRTVTPYSRGICSLIKVLRSLCALIDCADISCKYLP